MELGFFVKYSLNRFDIERLNHKSIATPDLLVQLPMNIKSRSIIDGKSLTFNFLGIYSQI